MDVKATEHSWLLRNKLKIAPWVFLIPALAFFAVYVIEPIFESIWLSFYEWNGLYRADGTSTAVWVGVDNYIKLWDDPKFWTSLKNNLLWLLLFMLAVPIGLMIALFLNQTVSGMRIYKSLFFFPFVISQVVVGLIFGWFYNPDFGVVGSVWKALFCEETINIVGNVSFRCSSPPPDILSSPEFATYGIIAAGLWPQIAYCMILYLTGLNNVAADQIEAGRLDGAKGWRMLWFVVLPQLRPATFIAVVVTVIGALRSFDMIAIMTQGGPFGSTNVLAYYMYETAISEYGERYGYGSAIATVLFLIMLIYISYFLWRMYQDEKGGR
ncbi:carbohydrate ABC transporter membrane protein 1, CUT1 family [Poseidonocella pacifica]|uniref:Carbohydrate ABC transporter membrane protein 1, CUT1 family n=1 Tax=Poseidonocella pacifica TaxID=871651 RepID=A0A1I0XY23_9RHOB|nr:sugar ABC transporter permease [Poseidonocella pacifica]SFB04843.1 carbohydrate ABC transporter membrane protein 1, CUT1 family [Poseidonocella pacifica]